MWRQQGSEVGERREGWAVPVPESGKAVGARRGGWSDGKPMVETKWYGEIGGRECADRGLSFCCDLERMLCEQVGRVWRAARAQIGSLDGRERRRAAEQTATKQTDRAFEGCVR